MTRQTIRWLCRSNLVNDKGLMHKECGYTWIAPKIIQVPKCPRCSGTNVVKLEDYFEKAPLQ